MWKEDRVQNWIGKQVKETTRFGTRIEREKGEEKKIEMNAISNYFGLRRRRWRRRTHENWLNVETAKNALCCAHGTAPLTATTIGWTRWDGCDADEEHLFSSSFYALDGSRTLGRAFEWISHYDVCSYFREPAVWLAAMLYSLRVWPFIFLHRSGEENEKCPHRPTPHRLNGIVSPNGQPISLIYESTNVRSSTSIWQSSESCPLRAPYTLVWPYSRHQHP